MEGKLKVSKKALLKNFQKIINRVTESKFKFPKGFSQGDPAFEILIEHGEKQFGWKTNGTLVIVKNFKVSRLLAAANTGKNVLDPESESVTVDFGEAPEKSRSDSLATEHLPDDFEKKKKKKKKVVDLPE
jgi:hypothetical protein